MRARLSLLSVAFAAIWMNTAAAGPVMGSGLRNLVNAWETADPRLSSHMEFHLKSPQGEPLVQVHLEPGANAAALLPALEAAGFRLTAQSKIDPGRLEGFLPLSRARAAAGVTGVKSVHAVQRPRNNVGAVQSQAVALHKADVAQAKGVDGKGIKIGVLSDSYNACGAFCATTAPQDIASGDLPAAGVTVLSDLAPDTGSDEGRAMLQLVHDIAPGSQLGFASAFLGQVAFANSIIDLRAKFGADVIVDDVIYFAEPMFSDGIIAQAVDIVARDGAAYFSSAGNNGIEAYEANYLPIPFDRAKRVLAVTGSNVKLDQIPADIRPQSVHVFRGIDSGDFAMSITQRFSTAASNILIMQWDEPFFLGKVATDYNMYVFDANGNWMDPLSAAFPGFYTTDDNVATDAPFEFILLPPFAGDIKGGANVSDYQIVIGKANDGPARRIKYVVSNGLGVSQFQGAGSVWGHAAARGGQAVAATYYAEPKFPEDFSSPGPVTILLDADGNRLREPQVRAVPQITAADGTDTTFFGFDSDGNGLPNFFGTSAAAPNAAAVAALALQAAGGPGSLRPRNLYRLLQKTAAPIPLPEDRNNSSARIGALSFTANGDWTRWADYWGFELDKRARSTVTTVSIDLADTGLVFSRNPARFHVGESTGIARADIVQTVSLDQKVMTLSFAAGKFSAGQSFRFGMSAFSAISGSTQIDADRLRGAKITAQFDNGTSSAGAVTADRPRAINRFTGAGIVNAAAAVAAAGKRGEHEHDDDDD